MSNQLEKKYLTNHLELHEMKEHGLKFYCKECSTSFAVRSSLMSHLRKFHGNKQIEPVIVLDE